jgi:hypothetical protein
MPSHHGPLSYQSLHSSQPPTAQLSQPCPNCQKLPVDCCSSNQCCIIVQLSAQLQLFDPTPRQLKAPSFGFATTPPTHNVNPRSLPSQPAKLAAACWCFSNSVAGPAGRCPNFANFCQQAARPPTSWPQPHTVPGTLSSQANPAVDKKRGEGRPY